MLEVPKPGDTTRAGLWLDSISHTGLAGVAAGARTQETTPDIHFVGVQMPNRVDAIDKDRPALVEVPVGRMDRPKFFAPRRTPTKIPR